MAKAKVNPKLRKIEKYLEDLLYGCICFIKDLTEERTNEKIDFENPAECMQVLYDSSFNVDDYKQIGVNDGHLEVVRAIALTLGRNDIAEKARVWKYE